MTILSKLTLRLAQSVYEAEVTSLNLPFPFPLSLGAKNHLLIFLFFKRNTILFELFFLVTIYTVYGTFSVEFLTVWDWTEHSRSTCFFHYRWLLFGCFRCWRFCTRGTLFLSFSWFFMQFINRLLVLVKTIRFFFSWN